MEALESTTILGEDMSETVAIANSSNHSSMFSFKLSEDFLKDYRAKKAPFGYSDAVGNSVGEITFLRTYSRLKEDGTKETWVDVCERVINGMYSLQKNHCKENRLPWNDVKAQASAKEAFDRLFNLKWTPPGRGLWVMGTSIVMEQRNSAALQNCSFISSLEMTKANPSKPFAFLMEASMLGVGVGFDDKGADKDFTIYEPRKETSYIYQIPDTREGWVESVSLLINSFLKSDQSEVTFDYSLIRPSGAPIKTFGGVAAGHDPLLRLHNHITKMFTGRAGEKLTRVDIADIGNMIGVCVVSGNVRRCLPAGTWIHTFNGPKKIEDITTKDYVVTPHGKYRVTNFFDQGVQKTVKIVHQFGEFECTPNHQVAVFSSINDYEFKMAADLVPGDRLVWDSNGIDGMHTALPSFEWSRKDKDHTGIDITIPELTGDVAWVLGQLMGDGYVFLPGGKTPNGYVSFAVAKNTPHIKDKLVSLLPAFGVVPIVTDGDGECWKVSVYNNQFAHYMSQFKLSHNRFQVPHFISNGTREVRSGFLMGLFDADGSSRTRPINAVTSTNVDFVTDTQKVYASLGIATKMRLSRSEDYRENWKPLYSLDVVGVENVQMFTEMAANHSVKFVFTAKTKRSANGFTFDTKMVKASLKINWPSKNITSARLAEKHDFHSTLKPVEVIEIIDSGREVQTYDIEVDSVHQFVAEGFVVHNSAELLIGHLDDENFLNLKNAEVFPERNSYDPDSPGWGWMSNNSVAVSVGDDLSSIIDGIALNGEPGVIWMDMSRKYGRLADPPNDKDWRVGGFNPCAEQSLESWECCTLVETYLGRHDSLDDYKRTLKFAYLYAKTVTLLATHWEETNAIMQRNRRIGTSMSGIADFADIKGLPVLRQWMDEGYHTVCKYDTIYSEWLGIRESIKKTTVKPSGSVSILAGESPGVHWTPGGEFFLRAIRFSNDDPMLSLFRMANYRVEPASESPDTTSVVFFPIRSNANRSEKDVSIFEKAALAATAQRYWSDNSVSVTVSFDAEEEKDQVGTILHMYDGQLKTVSFLPEGNFTYPQMPYTQISEQEYNDMSLNLMPIDFSGIYAGLGKDAIGENYCTTDSCEIKFVKENAK